VTIAPLTYKNSDENVLYDLLNKYTF